MVLVDGFLGVLAFGLWVFCIIDVLVTPRPLVRNLPKIVWIVVVVVFATIGALAWLALGRPWRREGVLVGAGRARPRVTSPDDDDEFLAALDARVREQRRRQDPDAGDATG